MTETPHREVAPPPADDASPTSSSPVTAWLAALGGCGAVFLFMWAYHAWWRAKPYSLATANEALALAALLGLAGSLVPAPLHALTGRGEHALRLGRPLLLVAGLFAALHLLCTGLLSPAQFGPGYFAAHPALLGLGVAAAALLLARCATLLVETDRWRALERLDLLLLLLVLLHFLVLGKPQAWLDWLRVHDRPAPPGTLPAVALCLVPFVLALLAALRRRAA